MSRKGDCWDTVVAESFFGTLKSETVFGEKFKPRLQAKRHLIDYIEMFYNSQRRHSYLGYLTPMEFEIKIVLQKVA
jgi:transposase InsO family protein